MKTKQSKFQAGFTILELLVVISIITLLSSVIISSVANARRSARDVLRYSERKPLIDAINLYYQEYGQWPTTTNPANTFIPGNTWFCLGPASEKCWSNTFYGDDVVYNRLLQYIQKLPVSRADPNSYAYNRLLFSPHQNANFGGYNEDAGAYLTWASEAQIPASKCPSKEPPLQFDKYWYCTEYLGQ